jgi:UDP-glucose:(heptosyl)LPS alpha-1,3-glucosyltransferase
VEYFFTRHSDTGHPNISFHAIPDRFHRNALSIAHFAWAARRRLRESGVDVTHSFGGVIGCDVVSAQSCHRAGMAASKPRSGEIREAVNLGVADRIRLFLEKENFGKRQYRRIVACSQRVKRELCSLYDVPEGDITIVLNGVDLAAFEPGVCRSRRSETREKYGIRETDFLLLFAGHEFARKGLQTVLEAMRLMSDSSIRILVAGEGRPDKYMRFARESGIQDQVTFAGHVQDMALLYGAADLFVFPTLYEAFGLVITEAMASGLPVLVSASAGAAEDLIRDGQDGMLISDPRDSHEVAGKIRTIKENRELRTTLASLGRLRVLRTGWEEYGRELIAVYEEVLALKKAEGTRASHADSLLRS